MKAFESRKHLQKGAKLRTYKVGQLPSIEISQQNLIEPLIYLSMKDYELSSEMFLQLVETTSSFDRDDAKMLKNTVIQFMKGSKKREFNFISTLQKVLIRICQRFNIFTDFSMKEIAMESNTLDYAILFTE